MGSVKIYSYISVRISTGKSMNVTRDCSLAFGSLSAVLFVFLFFVGEFESGACRLRAMLCGCVRDFVDVDVWGEGERT